MQEDRPVWRAIACLLSRCGLDCGYLSWGTVSFLHHLPGSHLLFHAEADAPILMLRPAGYAMATMEMLPLQQTDFSRLPRDERFTFIVSLSLWCIWKARCSHILSQLSSTSADTLAYIWQELIHTLKARWDASTGSSRAAEERQIGRASCRERVCQYV